MGKSSFLMGKAPFFMGKAPCFVHLTLSFQRQRNAAPGRPGLLPGVLQAARAQRARRRHGDRHLYKAPRAAIEAMANV